MLILMLPTLILVNVSKKLILILVLQLKWAKIQIHFIFRIIKLKRTEDPTLRNTSEGGGC